MKKKIHKILGWKYFYLMIVILFSLAFISPLLFFYINGDDTAFHLLNINLYSKISIFDKIVPTYANGLGWGVGIFYPCLPHILGAMFLNIIKYIGFSYVMAIKMVKVIIVLLAGIIMYFLANKLYKSNIKAMFASLFYLSSSYFLVDFYMRDALNESMLFIFVPLIFLSMFYLFKENATKKFYISFIIGYTGMIYSHLVLTMWFTILLMAFLLLYLKKVFQKKYFYPLLISSIIVIILTSTFTIPLIEHMFVDKWHIPTYKNVWVLPLKDYFYPSYYSSSNDGLLFVNLTYFIIILSIIGIYNLLFNKKFKDDKKFILGILIVGILSLFLGSFKPFWEHAPSIFKNIQFAWRLATFSTFSFSIFAVSALDNVYNLFKNKYKYVMTLFLITLVVIYTYQNLSKVNFYRSIDYDNNVMFMNLDYFPIKSFENMDYIKSLDNNSIAILDGKCSVSIQDNKTPYLKFEVTNIEDYVSLELPRFYYLGYEITDITGKKYNYTEDKYGLISLNLSKDGIYEVKYTDTIFYKIAIIIKSLLLIGLLILLIRLIKKKKISNLL